MPTEESIRNAVQSLKTTYALRKVSVFGSYAEGRATADSMIQPGKVVRIL